jgi:pimeloyl-ACP methyl ester carboxylesterase
MSIILLAMTYTWTSIWLCIIGTLFVLAINLSNVHCFLGQKYHPILPSFTILEKKAVVKAYSSTKGTTSTASFTNSAATTSTTKQSSGSKVRFISPLLELGYPPAVLEAEQNLTCQKPFLLYLPGFDGTLLSPFLQFPELGTTFEVQGMIVPMEDRSTLDNLRDMVVQKLLSVVTLNNNCTRPVYLVGESFGGILALEVLLHIQDQALPIDVKGLTLVNPATCYTISQLAQLGPAVAAIQSPATYTLSFIRNLLPLFLDDYQIPQLLLILSAKALPSVIDTPQREAYMGRVALSLPSTLKFMPQPTLQWRLNQWLQVGCEGTQKRLQHLSTPWNTPTLIVVGEVDKTLPSLDEAQRLSSFFNHYAGKSNGSTSKTCQVFVVKGAGHASTCGSRIDLAAVLRDRFPELQRRQSSTSSKCNVRTQMKDIAQKGTGKLYGMEPRYDGKLIGLSPFLYWSSEYYKKSG